MEGLTPALSSYSFLTLPPSALCCVREGTSRDIKVAIRGGLGGRGVCMPSEREPLCGDIAPHPQRSYRSLEPRVVEWSGDPRWGGTGVTGALGLRSEVAVKSDPLVTKLKFVCSHTLSPCPHSSLPCGLRKFNGLFAGLLFQLLLANAFWKHSLTLPAPNLPSALHGVLPLDLPVPQPHMSPQRPTRGLTNPYMLMTPTPCHHPDLCPGPGYRLKLPNVTNEARA